MNTDKSLLLNDTSLQFQYIANIISSECVDIIVDKNIRYIYGANTDKH